MTLHTVLICLLICLDVFSAAHEYFCLMHGGAGTPAKTALESSGRAASQQS
jgi:hypothetical protein